MPGRDGLGPMGQGPMTGRGMGVCGNGNNPVAGRNAGRGMGIGRGVGRGLGIGRGFGRRMGAGRGFGRMQPPQQNNGPANNNGQ